VPRLSDGRVLVGVRTKLARSWPGTIAFPGGACDDGDDALPLLSGARSLTRGCALRELGEETGLWRVCHPDGSLDGAAAAACVTDVLAGSSLADALARHALVLDDRGLVPLVAWKTWDGRFAVQQFLLALTDAEPERHAIGVEELADLRFIHASTLREGWRRGEVFLIPPIRRIIVELARHEHDVERALPALRADPTAVERARHDLVEGVCMVPARSPTLPPATHTNAVLLGSGDALLVDPATPWTQEQGRFDRQLAACLNGQRVRAIVCTHHHADHVGDVERLRTKHRCPVWAHAATAALVPFPIDRILEDGEVLACDGPVPRAFRVVFSPGHAPGHICLFEEETRLLVAGDMVAGIGSIIIDPPDGHMGTYLASLARLIALRPRALIPAHGPLLVDGTGRLEEQLAHRGKRQAAVRAQLGDAPGVSIRQVVDSVYGADTAPALWPLAERSVLAALELCVERNEAITDGSTWWRAPG
jgi:glyoxylase-like metal-dependent hydrolase (beta-lactamase superfamily II)/8-oxo-dGTP pyrophosphatase MutT (NUDIX family)